MSELALMAVEQTALSAQERRDLERLEDTIQQCEVLIRQSRLQQAEALLEIRMRRLYREHGTFEVYCRERWKLEHSRANQLLDAACVLRQMKTSTIVEVFPENECQIRPLVALETPEERVAVWQLVHAITDNEPVTGKRVVAAVQAWNEVVAAVGAAGMSPNEIRGYVERRLQAQSKPPEEAVTPEPAAGKYNVIYADPPWRYEGGTTTPNRIIEHQYPTLKLDDICGGTVGEMVHHIADKNCVLFLWSTAPKLGEAMRVIEAWGFDYRTNIGWVKTGSLGLGNYVRQNLELLLIAIKGKPGCPETKVRPHSPVEEKKGRHSEKPTRFYEIIEMMYPHAKRMELFARTKRDGWDAWGNEAPNERESLHDGGAGSAE